MSFCGRFTSNSKLDGDMFQRQKNWISDVLWKPKKAHSLEQLRYCIMIDLSKMLGNVMMYAYCLEVFANNSSRHTTSLVFVLLISNNDTLFLPSRQ